MDFFKKIGQFFSGWLKGLFENKEAKILFLGLDAAGKTSALYKIQLDENVSTIPTIGFNAEVIQYKKVTFRVFDIGGQDKIRKLWRHYYQSTNAIIFIVDSNDTERFKEAAETLREVMQDDLLKDAKLLVWANKQDLPRAANVKDMVNTLKLHEIKQEWYIQPCSALSGNGLFEGLDWLSSKL
ncbi:ARF/SAR family small GTPase [Naegleria gruberi]|uniref:ARF/SAR family small GTPase n=1 Tax=Naegleria gruberi TaxID=5762 RepID=D2VU99_NAEGR|nr:ARF/SAR family small GTPase [Naegleria gruberi]EFC39591.1 ARF/SAR family small GTPase [Naegleria gruberi]|eukprot:XP_002672335.1 ARF/SAR family small GTPase [Naegleria gruberi strain NEG-M]